MSNSDYTMRPWWSAEDKKQAESAVAVITLPGLALVAVAAVGAVWIASGGQPLATLPQWITPRHGIIAGIAALIVLTGWVFVARRWWRHVAPTGEGFATRSDVTRHLSEAAARKKAKVTRPDLSAGRRRSAPPTAIGVPFHETPWGQRMFLPLENPTGVIAPTQSGKSLTDLIHKVLGAPGALITTSTKLDLFRLTAMHRERLHGEGTVQVLDLTGTSGWPYQVRWNPLSGCEDWRTATRRAKALIAGTNAGQQTTGNHRFFESRAAEVLACYLQAGAMTNVHVDEFVAWCVDATDNTATEILMDNPVTQDHGLILRKAQQLVPETRDGIWETLRDSVSCLTDPLTRSICSPDPGRSTFDFSSFLTSNGTIYVIGSEEAAADLAPLVTAFVETVLFEATQYALSHTEGRDRLGPPLTAVLDELPSICPLPKLPVTISDSAGRGVLIHWAAQSQSQLEHSFGREGAETLIDNTTALTIFGGLKSKSTLEWLSSLCGRRIEERRSRKSEVIGINLDRQISQERTELLTPAQIRELPPGRVLVIFRFMSPLIAVTRRGWELPEWPQLQKDRAEVIERGRMELLTPVEDGIEDMLRLEGVSQ